MVVIPYALIASVVPLNPMVCVTMPFVGLKVLVLVCASRLAATAGAMVDGPVGLPPLS